MPKCDQCHGPIDNISGTFNSYVTLGSAVIDGQYMRAKQLCLVCKEELKFEQYKKEIAKWDTQEKY